MTSSEIQISDLGLIRSTVCVLSSAFFPHFSLYCLSAESQKLHNTDPLSDLRRMYVMSDQPWYGVRLVYRLASLFESAYEERVVIVRATSATEAIARAEALSRENYESETTVYINYAMAFHIIDECGGSLGAGAEVFSLVRKSHLSSGDYLDRFHDTGKEFAR